MKTWDHFCCVKNYITSIQMFGASKWHHKPNLNLNDLAFSVFKKVLNNWS